MEASETTGACYVTYLLYVEARGAAQAHLADGLRPKCGRLWQANQCRELIGCLDELCRVPACCAHTRTHAWQTFHQKFKGVS
jgi:hypothetical protein